MQGETVVKREMLSQMEEDASVRDCIMTAVGAAVLKKASFNGEITSENLGWALFEMVGIDQIVEMISGEFGDQCFALLKRMQDGQNRSEKESQYFSPDVRVPGVLPKRGGVRRQHTGSSKVRQVSS